MDEQFAATMYPGLLVLCLSRPRYDWVLQMSGPEGD